MNYRHFAAVSAIALMAAVPAWAQASRPALQSGMGQSSGTQQASPQDARFMKEAATGGKAEVELGKLAEQKAARPEIREFGRWMATDHTFIDNWLQEVAQPLGVSLPTALGQQHEQIKDHLAGLSGSQFDRAYIDAMVSEHRKDVPAFQTMAQSAQSPALKTFAQQVTPILQQHLAEAETLAKGLTVAQSRTGAAAVSGSSTAPGAGTMGSGTSAARRAHRNAVTDSQTQQLNSQELKQMQPQAQSEQ